MTDKLCSWAGVDEACHECSCELSRQLAAANKALRWIDEHPRMFDCDEGNVPTFVENAIDVARAEEGEKT